MKFGEVRSVQQEICFMSVYNVHIQLTPLCTCEAQDFEFLCPHFRWLKAHEWLYWNNIFTGESEKG